MYPLHQPQDAVIYDAEIRLCIPSGEREEGLQYCNGWGDHANMGITVICAYDMANCQPRIFLRDNLDDFVDLVSRREFLIGFNSINFDDKLCAANGMHVKTTFDLMNEAKVAGGFKKNARVSGYSLKKLSIASIGEDKTATGDLAPKMWQQKRFGAVIDYCMNDVMLTLKLLLQGWQTNLTCPVNNTPTNKLRSLLEAKHDGAQLGMFT